MPERDTRGHDRRCSCLVQVLPDGPIVVASLAQCDCGLVEHMTLEPRKFHEYLWAIWRRDHPRSSRDA